MSRTRVAAVWTAHRPVLRTADVRPDGRVERQKSVVSDTRTARGEPGLMLLLLWAVAK